MADITIKRGDTYPPLVLGLSDANGVINLTGVSEVRLLIKDSTPPNTTVTTGALSISNAALGQVTYNWELDDLLAIGVYNCEVEINWSGSLWQTVPNNGYFTLQVGADLGGEH